MVIHPLMKEFIGHLERKDKERCVELALSWLERGDIDIVTLYNEILTPSLNTDFCKNDDKGTCIWEEHIRSSIIRTILENCYPYIIKERDRTGPVSHGRVVVVCPSEEYHEIGPRMVADFFTLVGFDVVFVGANTPQDEILETILHQTPMFVAISVTNNYNLIAARRVVEKMRKVRTGMRDKFEIIVGGNAFQRNPGACKEMGADRLLHTFEDIKGLAKEG